MPQEVTANFNFHQERLRAEVESVFRVRRPVKAVWAFLSDRHAVVCLFPGCRGVTILNDLDAIWKLRVTFGPFSKTMNIKTRTTVFKEFERLSWVGTGDHMHLSGDVILKKISDDVTEVTYGIEGHATGPFSTLQDIVVHEKLKNVSKKFIGNIQNELEWSLDEEEEAKERVSSRPSSRAPF